MADEKKIDIIKAGKPFSLPDIVAISLSVILCAALIIFFGITREQGTTVVITLSTERKTSEYDLNTNREIPISTDRGEFLVVIKDGTVYVKASPCRGQDCVYHSPIRYSGQVIVCADLKIHIAVKGKGGLHAVT